MSRYRINMFCFVALVTGLALVLAPAAQADPIKGRDILKFSQQPMDGTEFVGPDGTSRKFFGHDELSTAYGSIDPNGLPPQEYRGQFMADDFADRFASPVVHVKWWGSYLENFLPTNQRVDRFLISFEEDVPADSTNPDSFSRPGEPILNQIVRRGPLAPGSGTFTESPISPGGDPLNERLFEYNAELHLNKEFFQEPDTVYWLKIVALVDLPPGFDPAIDPVLRWGWHNRDYTIPDPLASVPPAVVPGEHVQGLVGPAVDPTRVWHFQDDAVTGGVVINTGVVPGGQIMPIIDQFNYQPTHYVDFWDGPQGIGQLSKDLAFELYTVPEPASVLLMGIAIVLVGRRTARPRRT